MRVVCRWPFFGILALLPLPAAAQIPFNSTVTIPPTTTAVPKAAKSPPMENVPQPGGDKGFVGQPQADPYNSVVLDNADTVTSEGSDGNQYVLRGNVELRYKGYTLTSDRADIDLDRETALFTGNVVMRAPSGETVTGGQEGTLALNLRRSTYQITGGMTTVPPQELGLGLILPVYIYGGTITGRPGLIDARGSEFTTCDFTNPHYAIAAKQLYMVPGSHLVAKYITYYRDGHRLFTYPYLYLPLDRRLHQSQFIPQFGYTPETGYFAKVALAYLLKESLPGLLNLNVSQKQGLGIGVQQAFGDLGKPHDASGVASLFEQHDNSTGLQELSYGLTDNQKVGTVQVALNTQGQQNSSYVSNSSSLSQNTQLNLTRNVGAFNTTLQNNLTQSDYGDGLSQTLTSSLDNVYSPRPGTRLETKFNYSDVEQPSFGTNSADQQQLESDVDYTQTGKVADVEILANMYNQLSGGTGSGYGGLERLPEVRLASDGGRLKFLKTLLLPLQTKINLSLGDFNEPLSVLHTHTTRALFGIDLGTTTHNIRRSTVTYGGAFQQAFYGDDTAEYTLKGNAGYQFHIGGKSSAGVQYNYLRPYGYTPFQFDFVGTTNNSALNFSYQETKQVQLTLATAYDFNQARSLYPGESSTPWQNLAVQLLYKPSPLFQSQTTAAYDPNHGKLLDVTDNLSLRAPGGYGLDLATRYDPVKYRFSEANYSVNIPFTPKVSLEEESDYRLQIIGGYNGDIDQFQYQGIAVTRDWHDFSLSLVYQDDQTNSLQSGRTFTLNFQLKAFPAFQPFGVGEFGQGLEPGLGTVY
jgi:hypothetical protein